MKIPFRPTIICVALFCSLFFVECKKLTATDNAYNLPNATQSGAAVFATELEGIGIHNNPDTVYTTYVKFIADNDLNDPFYSSSGNGAWLYGDTLVIKGAPQVGSYFQGITFTLIGNLQQGIVYSIDDTATMAMMGTDSTCNGVNVSPIPPTISVSDSGTVQLTKFDTINKIVSGTFSCKFPFSMCGDSSVYAMEGRFDYKYQ